jgi:uncharacterized protein Yka (UPF0111/DUF47 family)
MTQTQSAVPPWWQRLWQMIVPPMPDFYGMLEAQADNLRSTVAALADFLQTCDQNLAALVHDSVDKGHNLRDKTLSQLYRSFITPIDREDIYTLALAIDHILDYLKNTVREVEVLQVESDDWMRRMTAQLAEGVASLALGLARFRAGQAEAVAHTVQTRESERAIEDLYRDALEEMFQGEEYLKLSNESARPSVHACLDFVISRIKRREVYRHLSNAADRLAHAGEALRNISIKYDSGGTGVRP